MAKPKATSKATADVFISCASADGAWAEWIAGLLAGAGITVFYAARTLGPGDDWSERTSRSLARARVVIAVLSPAYTASRWTATEWGMATVESPSGKGARLLPVRVVPFRPEAPFGDRHYLDLVELSPEDAAARLIEEVARSLDLDFKRPIPIRPGAPYPGAGRAPEAGSDGPSSPPTTASRPPPLPADIDLLTLAFRLVAANKAAPTLLRTLDLHVYRQALLGAGVRTIDAASLRELGESLPSVPCNRLWLAWTRRAHADLVERLAKELPGEGVSQRSA